MKANLERPLQCSVIAPQMPISREPIIQEALANVAATTTSASESTTTVNKVRKRPQTSEVNASQHAPTRTETLNDPNLFRSHLDGIDQALNILCKISRYLQLTLFHLLDKNSQQLACHNQTWKH